MTWFKRDAHEISPTPDHEVRTQGLWIKCDQCRKAIWKGDLDEKKLSDWLGTLLRTKGQDIFRMKGVLAVKGRDMRFVFQGVHMLMDGKPDRPWGNDPRENAIIFIGRNLDREMLTEGFRACLA